MRTVVFVLLLAACDIEPGASQAERVERDQQSVAKLVNAAPCRDTATLVATTAGSPNEATCPHRLHRARVEAATKAGEEIGAVVFCECQREEKKP